MKKVLKLFVVFSMCLSQLFFAALYSNVSAIQDDDQIVEEVDQDNTEKDTTSETTQDESENNNGEEKYNINIHYLLQDSKHIYLQQPPDCHRPYQS